MAWRTALTAGPVPPPVLHAAPGTKRLCQPAGARGGFGLEVCVQSRPTHSLSANAAPPPCNLPFRPCSCAPRCQGCICRRRRRGNSNCGGGRRVCGGRALVRRLGFVGSVRVRACPKRDPSKAGSQDTHARTPCEVCRTRKKTPRWSMPLTLQQMPPTAPCRTARMRRSSRAARGVSFDEVRKRRMPSFGRRRLVCLSSAFLDSAKNCVTQPL